MKSSDMVTVEILTGVNAELLEVIIVSTTKLMNNMFENFEQKLLVTTEKLSTRLDAVEKHLANIECQPGTPDTYKN